MWQIIVQIIELQKWCNKDGEINKREEENCARTQKNGNEFSWKNLQPVVQFSRALETFYFMINWCPEGKI